MTHEFVFVLAVLACFRGAQLIALDDGWDDCLLKFRIWCAKQNKSFSKLVSCPYCVGIWLALPLAFWCIDIGLGIFLVWFAIAGGQAFLQGLVDK